MNGGPRQSIADVFDDQDNNFNLIRMVAAIVVIFSHSFALLRLPDPIALYTSYFDGGDLAVSVFFIVSGFLVVRSIEHRKTIDYFKARALRILPALAFVVLFDIFVIGPLFTQLTLADYFRDSKTWAHMWSATVFRITFTLPGVFQHNPATSGINGSLWTLPIEFGFYILLPVIFALGLLKGKRVLVLMVLALVGTFIALGIYHLDSSQQGPTLFKGATVFFVTKYGVFFLSGACFWLLRSKIPYDQGLALALLLIFYIFASNSVKAYIPFIALPYLVIYAAVTKVAAFRFYQRLGDFSYGTYIFAFPVQQSLIAIIGSAIGPYLLFFAALPIVLILAVASWFGVERPALALKHWQPSYRESEMTLTQ